MGMTILIGCDAVDAGELLRVHLPGGSLRTIAWPAITMAAAPVNDTHMTFEGELSPISKLRATHDVLWIVHGEDVDVLMLEKDDPRRQEIFDMVQQRVGTHWSGARISMQDLAMRMMRMPMAGGGRMMKVMLIAVLVMFGMVLLTILISKFSH